MNFYWYFVINKQDRQFRSYEHRGERESIIGGVLIVTRLVFKDWVNKAGGLLKAGEVVYARTV